MAQGGRGKKRCHFPPEGDTIGSAITRKCKLGMLTYITMDISLCPPEWYQSAKFRLLAHALVLASGGTKTGIVFARVSAEIRKMLSQEDAQPLFLEAE